MKNKNSFFWRSAALLTAFGTALLAPPALADDPYAAQPGSLDLHFGEWGLGIGTSPAGRSGVAHSIGVDSTGQIIVGGATCFAADCHPVLMRFDDEGHRDASGSFDANAMLVLGDVDYSSKARVFMAPAGNDGWWVSWMDEFLQTWHLLKVDADGNFATGFAPGDVAHDTSSSMNIDLLPRPDGDALVAVSSNFIEYPLVFRQYLAEDGALDPAFGDGGDGELVISFDDGLSFFMGSRMLPDGRIVTLVDWWLEDQPYLLMVNADGSGLDASFGDNGRLPLRLLVEDVLADKGIAGLSISAGALALTTEGSLRLGTSVCCNTSGNYVAVVIAINPDGTLDETFADEGVAFQEFGQSYLGVRALSVRPDNGMTLQLMTEIHDAFVFLAEDGSPNAAYGNGTGIVADVQLPGNGLMNPGGGFFPADPHTYDAAGGLLLAHSGLRSSGVIGLNGIGVARLLAPRETRTYDAVPNQLPAFTAPSAPKDVYLGFGQHIFGGRDVAVHIEADNGFIALPGEPDFGLPSEVILPLNVVVSPRHVTAPTPGTRTETTLYANGVEFAVLASVTGEDRQPDFISFAPRQDVALSSFVTSYPEQITGIDVQVDVAVENGCYYLFDHFDEVPEAFAQDDCTNSPGTAVNGQLLVLAHLSAGEVATAATTTFHVGIRSASFTSTTVAVAQPPLPDTEADVIAFAQQDGVIASTFVVSTPALVSGINMPISISVENGCYFLFDDVENVPDVFAEDECETTPIEATDGQVIVVGHTSAGAPETQTVSTLHYSAASAPFVSITGAAAEPEPEPEPEPEAEAERFWSNERDRFWHERRNG